MNQLVFPTTNQIDTIQSVSKQLKAGFKQTELKPWDAVTISSELLFQCTHLLNAIISSTTPDAIGPLEGVNKGLNDETADVLFNLMNVANAIDINASQFLPSTTSATMKSTPLISANNLIIQAGELWDGLAREHGYKHPVREKSANRSHIHSAFAGSLIALCNTSALLDVNLNDAFFEMHQDANNFLKNFQNNEL